MSVREGEVVIGEPGADLAADERAVRAVLQAHEEFIKQTYRLLQHRAEALLLAINAEAEQVPEDEMGFARISDLVGRADAAYQDSIRYRKLADEIEEAQGR
jgi:hypothetical protein